MFIETLERREFLSASPVPAVSGIWKGSGLARSYTFIPGLDTSRPIKVTDTFTVQFFPGQTNGYIRDSYLAGHYIANYWIPGKVTGNKNAWHVHFDGNDYVDQSQQIIQLGPAGTRIVLVATVKGRTMTGSYKVFINGSVGYSVTFSDKKIGL